MLLDIADTTSLDASAVYAAPSELAKAVTLSHAPLIFPFPSEADVSGQPETASTSKAAIRTSLQTPSSTGEIPNDVLARLAVAAPAFAPGSPQPPERDNIQYNFEKYGIVGDDDREAINVTADFPANGIAHILYASPDGKDKLCSGAMIGPDVVLTAAHCAFTKAWHSSFLVIPARNAAIQPLGSCGVREIYVYESWTLPAPAEAVDIPASNPVDLAVFRLDCTFNDEVGILTMRSITDDQLELTSVLQGYPGEIVARGRQFRGEGQVVRAASGGVLHHLIDSTGGMSGAPIWAADDPRIFAVQIGMEPGIGWTPENQIAFFNYATRLTPERLAVIAAWLAD